MIPENTGYYLGVDVGSLSTDAVLLDSAGNVAESLILPTGAGIDETLGKCMDSLSKKFPHLNFDKIPSVSTGYGRNRVVSASVKITEITAHALGAGYVFPDTATVIDMGGQDTKVIRLDRFGAVQDFVMNDKCSAGTGRFLEVMARILETDVNGMINLALTADRAPDITSTCTVFIESEIVSLIARGEERSSISAGVHRAIAGRITAMLKSIGAGPPYVLTGGVAKNMAMRRELEKILGGQVKVPDDPQIAGALGSAVYCMNYCRKP